jgi:LPXTG-site transpeptidase (sortase) family protein
MRRVVGYLLLVFLVVQGALTGSPAGAAVAPDTAERVVQAPRRLDIPAINVNAGIISVGVTPGGRLAIGHSVRDVYRWRNGVIPGQPGSAVLAGHTWSAGNGVFDNLGRMAIGDRVTVGAMRFKVTRVRRVTGMSQEDVAALFTDRGPARLVLITCGDRNNTTGVYRTRIIVNAKKMRSQ